jgi:NAD(P)-dependent dehydrogenase (short-subunit alcohol dehydrogenase family)
LPLTLDVTKAASIEVAARAASDVTLLINNAGVLDFGSIIDTPLEKIERNFGTNFYGTLAMARAFSPIIEKKWRRRDREYPDSRCACEHARPVGLQRLKSGCLVYDTVTSR